jgi:hypothetical protein
MLKSSRAQQQLSPWRKSWFSRGGSPSDKELMACLREGIIGRLGIDVGIAWLEKIVLKAGVGFLCLQVERVMICSRLAIEVVDVLDLGLPLVSSKRIAVRVIKMLVKA